MIQLTVGDDENENILEIHHFQDKVELHDFICGLDYLNAVIIFGQDKDDDDILNPLSEEYIVTEKLSIIENAILADGIFDFEINNLRFFLYVCESWEDAYKSCLDMREKCINCYNGWSDDK
jgi:hypothetical protein